MNEAVSRFPSLDELGRDLLEVPTWKRAASLVLPFLLVVAYGVFAAHGWWLAALGCPVLLSFFTYGSISHDLVHRTLRLPSWLNEVLLGAIELIALRSGHAYRITHLHHHKRFPAEDDVEAAAARMSWWGALCDGMTLQFRLYALAVRKPGPQRKWVVGEGLALLALIAGAVMSLPWTAWPAIYVGMMIAGTWIFPIATVLIPHDASGSDELTQTRLFRGRVLSFLALEHLYHLEHHLYPQVPHHNWPELARRLDPHFAARGLRAITLLW